MAALDFLALPIELLPLGFRFRPTDEELINHYLKRKINGWNKADRAIIREIDVCKCEPWDLPEKSLIKSEAEWFFFAPKDRKYRNGRRSNRATEAGYWKATGKDRSIKTRAQSPITIGMKKTLVFYRGRAPSGQRTGWIMHEYRTVEPGFDWGHFVLCRLFKKPGPEEKSLTTSNADEMDSGGLSPAPTKSSPEDMVHGDDSLDEFTTPSHQDSLPTNLDEKTEETYNYSDISADIGAGGIDMDNKKEDPLSSDLCNLNPGYEQIGEEFYFGSPSEYLMGWLSFDDNGDGVPSMNEDGDNDLVAKFIDSILVNNVEDSPPEINDLLENATEVVPPSQVYHVKHESPLDSTFGIDSVIGDTVDIDALLPLEEPAFLPSSQLHRPGSPSNYFVPPTHNSENDLGAKSAFCMTSVDFHFFENIVASEFQSDSFKGNYMLESSAASNNLSGLTALSHDPFKNEPEPSAVDNSPGIGIKIRPRRPQVSANPNQVGRQGMEAHGNAFRRIRLQTSLHSRSALVSNEKSSNANGGHDEKAEMSESGENVGFETPTSNRATKMVHFGSSDNVDTAPSSDAEDAASPTEPDDLCVKPEVPPRHEAPKTASFYFGRVTVMIPVMLCVLCIGIGWFFSFR